MMPLFSTPTQFAALGLLLIAGWLFGLASHPGGKKWKARYLAERDAHAAARKDADSRATAAEQRAVEAEHENARLVKAAAAAPAVTPVVTPVATHESRTAPVAADTMPIGSRPASAYPSARSSALPAYRTDDTKRGWFDFDRR